MKKVFLIPLFLFVWTCCFAQNYLPDDYSLHKAVELLNNKQYDDALSTVDTYLKSNSKSSDAYTLRSNIQFKQGKYAAALTNINIAIKYYKKGGLIPLYFIYESRAEIYAETEMYDKSIADYTKVYNMLKNGDDLEEIHDVLYNRAQVYWEIGDYENAAADYKLMLTHDEADQVAMMGLVRELIRQEQFQDAIDLATKCEKLDNSYAEIYRFRMQAYNLNGDTQLAIDDVFRYIQKVDDPNSDYYYDILKKDLDYSLMIANTYCNNYDDISWIMTRIQIYEWLNDYEKALEAYNKLTDDYGESATLSYHKSYCYYELGNFTKAIEEIKKYNEQNNGGSCSSLIMLASYYEALGEYDDALENYTKAVEKEPRFAFPIQKRAWVYECIGNYKAAIDDYSAAIKIYDGDSESYYLRGRALYLQGDKELSQEDFSKVLEMDTLVTKDSRRHYALLFMGREKEGLQWIDKVVATFPDDAGSYYEKACVLALMGKKSEAIDALRTSFQKGYCHLAHVEKDRDLDAIRDLSAYKQLIEEYKVKFATTSVGPRAGAQDVLAVVTEIPMKRMRGGVYEVACGVNGLPLKFIFDTGASSVSISSVEASFMLKNGYLSSDDIKGKEYFSTATGEISEGTIIRLKEIKVGDAVLKNVDASVVNNQQAPLLLGQSVLERFGTITIDNINSKLIIKQ